MRNGVEGIEALAISDSINKTPSSEKDGVYQPYGTYGNVDLLFALDTIQIIDQC